MSVVVNSNIGALRTQRLLSANTSDAMSSVDRLASGLRIAGASDDAAGLAISASLNVDSRVLSQALRNVNDGVSTLAVVENALDQLSQITTRQQELATQAANGVLSLAQRRAIDTEAAALTSEYNRIVQSTAFNNQQLLNGTTTLRIQAGVGSSAGVSFDLGAQLTNSAASTSSSSTTQQIQGGVREITTIDFYNISSAEQGEIALAAAQVTNDSSETWSAQFSDGNSIFNSGGYGMTFQTVSGDYCINFYVADMDHWVSYSGSGSGIGVSIYSTDDSFTVANNVASAINSANAGVSMIVVGDTVHFTDWGSGDRSNFHENGVNLWTTHDGHSGHFNYTNSGFYLYSGTQSYHISFAPNSSSSGSTWATIGLSDGDSAATVSYKVAQALAGFGGGSVFSASDAGMHVFYGVLAAGGSTDVSYYDGGFGAVFAHVTTQGGAIDPIHGGDYLSFYDTLGNSYGFYFDLTGGEIPPTSSFPHATTYFGLNYVHGDLLTSKLTAVANQINASWGANFTASASGTVLTIANDAVGNPTPDLNYGGYGTSLSVSTTQGNSGTTTINYSSDLMYKTAHGLTTGQRIRFSSSVTMPAGLTAGTDYYAIKFDNDRFRIATSAANASTNTFINFTSSGEGTITLTAYTDTPVTIYSTTIAPIDLSTQSAARAVLPTLAQRQTLLQRELGAIGSSQSRLAAVTANLFAARENYTAAESRITDVDVATESAHLLRKQILQRSGIAVLAQANRAPELALMLLGR